MADDAAPWDIDPETSRELVRFAPEPELDPRLVGAIAVLAAAVLLAAVLLWLVR